MKTLYIWAVGLVALAFHCMGTTVRQRMYVQVFDAGNGTGITSTNCSSSIDCGRLCSNTPLCRRFFYNSIDRRCWISPNTLGNETTGGKAYRRHCPASKGFVTRLLGSHTRCLKDYYDAVPHKTAFDECTSQNAHLFLLKSDDDMVYLTTNGMYVAWIDADTNQMNWYGGPLEYAPWRVGYPVADECVFGFSMTRKFETNPCSSSMSYVCQIDV